MSELIRTLATASGMNGMAGGQVMDMAADSATYDLPTITRLQQLKTGALLAASVEMGAILGKVAAGRPRPICAPMPAISVSRSRLRTTCSTSKATRKPSARRFARTSEQGKQTFVTLMGVEGARDQARALVEQAAGHLAQYGEDASLLVSLAQFIVERDR